MKFDLKTGSAGAFGRFKNSNFAQAWLILVLALIFGSALAAVQVNLRDVIATNKLNETLERIPELSSSSSSYHLPSPPLSTLSLLFLYSLLFFPSSPLTSMVLLFLFITSEKAV